MAVLATKVITFTVVPSLAVDQGTAASVAIPHTNRHLVLSQVLASPHVRAIQSEVRCIIGALAKLATLGNDQGVKPPAVMLLGATVSLVRST
jgi:siroheme synthase